MMPRSSSDFSRVFELLDYQLERYPQAKAFNVYEADDWKGSSVQDVKERAWRLAQWLIAIGINKDDRITIIPRHGSSTWVCFDFGTQLTGAVTVPIHPTSSAEETEFILSETSCKICVVEDMLLAEKIKTLPSHARGITIKTIRELMELSTSIKLNEMLVQERMNQVNENDLLAILYTSGTSGIPKGAMLTHRNIVSNIKSILSVIPLEAGQRVVSFLPISHIFERTTVYAYLAFGAQVYFNQSLEHLAKDFQSVKPYLFTSVPRTLEKMYDVLYQQAEQRNWLGKKILLWALDIGERYRDREKNGFLYYAHLLFARMLVLNRLKQKLGGRITYVIVGAAALRPAIARLLSAAGIVPLAGYGMTEASPFISVNRIYPGQNQFDTVGLAVPGVEIKIDAPNEMGEGEIWVKGPNIMQGYFLRDDLTRQTLTPDGWLKTGDVGRLTEKHFLKITDRKKDIFKTSSGKYVAPQALESHLCSSPWIEQCMVIGFNRPFVVAVIVPNFIALESWCEENGIHWTAPPYMVHNIRVVQKFQTEIELLNRSLEGYKHVKKFILADGEWTVEGKLLTASFKVVRSKILERFQSEIEKLYE